MKEKNNIITDIDNDIKNEVIKHFYFNNTYYNSLDFIYKYIKEVIIEEISGYPKSYFKKIVTDIEDHRFSKEKSIETNSLYNNNYPFVTMAINQDFSGPGQRTKMTSSHRFTSIPTYLVMPTIFHEYNMSMQLGSQVYKYNATLNFKFDTAFEASNFASAVYNTLHVNKHYYPRYAELRYRLDKKLYATIRAMYKAKYDKDEDFLSYLNNRTERAIVREFDRATGNTDYFLLLQIRPLMLLQTPTQTNNNANGNRESIININVDIEIELPNTLYFSAPMPLLKELNVGIYEGIILQDKNDPVIQEEIKEQKKDNKRELVRNNNKYKDPNDIKLATMPRIDVERIEKVHKKELKYTSTLSIDDLSDILTIEDPLILQYIKKSKDNILKLFDEDSNELVPREVKIYDNTIDIILDTYVKDTIIVVQIFG